MKPITIIAICVICAATLMSGCVEDFTHRTTIDETIHLDGGSGYYYGGDGEVGNSSHSFRYTISAPEPVDVRVVPSRDEFDKCMGLKTYTHYPDLERNDVYRVVDTVTIPEHGGIIIINRNLVGIPLSIKVEYII